MYLSRVELNLGLRNTMMALESPSKIHGAVERAFEGERECRKLWRLDDLGGKKYVLILSEGYPDLESFSEQFGFLGKHETKDYTPLLNRISVGSKWYFRLTANPAFSKSRGDKKSIKMPHITPEYQKKWLAERAEKCGFSLNIDEFQTVRNKRYRFFKKSCDKTFRVSFLSVTFEGILTVTDEEKFKETLCKGIGREKAYGQGLLTIVRM